MRAREIGLFMTGLEQTFSNKGEPSKQVKDGWIGLLKKIDYKDASKAVAEMLADEGKEFYAFPFPSAITPYLKSINKQHLSCPCCNNSRWLIWWINIKEGEVTPAYICKCVSSKTFHDRDGLDICNNINCQNPKGLERIFVPPGWGYKQKAMLVFCKHSPSVTESHNWDKGDVVGNIRAAQKIINKGLPQPARGEK